MPKKEIHLRNHTVRIGGDFYEMLEDIVNARLANGNDKKKISIRNLTNILVKHDEWPVVQRDIIALKLRGGSSE